MNGTESAPSLAVFASPGRYVQGRNASAQLAVQLQAAGLEGPLLVCVDPVVRPLVEPAWSKALTEAGFQYEVVVFGGECTNAEIEALAGAGRALGAKTVVGAGGGKVLDTARAAADRLGLPVVNCPSAASTDAPCSALSVVYTAEGAFERYIFYKTHPQLVLVDTSVVARAPKRLLVSGMGDALATWFEARAAAVAHADNMLHGGTTITGVALAKLCYETLLADGPAACAAVDMHAVTPALERIVEANTLLSGLGFETAGLAVAHAVHNGLTAAPGSHKMLHGEKVNMGTITQLALEGAPPEEVDAVYRFSCTVGLPVTLAQVGVDAGDDALLSAIAERATAPGETSHNMPFKVTAAAVKDAMLVADKLGHQWLASWPAKPSTA